MQEQKQNKHQRAVNTKINTRTEISTLHEGNEKPCSR